MAKSPPSDPKYKVTLTLSSGHVTVFYCGVLPEDLDETGTTKLIKGTVWRNYDAEAKKGKKGSNSYKFLVRRSAIDLIEIVDL